MRRETANLTTAAVCTALAVIMCVFTVFLPFSFMPLYFAAFCFYLVCRRANPVYGILSALATIGIMFAMSGLSVSWFMLVLMFAPYGIIAYFIRGMSYFKVKSAIIRAVVAAAFFNISMGLVYLVATRVILGMDIPVIEWVNKLGGYWVLAIIATAVLVPLDFVFWSMSAVVVKRLPSILRSDGRSRGADGKNGKDEGNEATADASNSEKKVDIFGYEIYDGDGGKTDTNRPGATETDGAEVGLNDEADGSDGVNGHKNDK